MSGAILLAAGLFPGVFAPGYRLSGRADNPDTDAVQAVPLAGQPDHGDLGDPEWPDAAKAALVQGGLRMQVVAVSLGPVKVPAGAAKKYTAEKYLVVRLRVHRAEAAGQFTRDWHVPPARDAGSGARLTDDAGRSYQPRQLADGGGVESVRQAGVFPVAITEEAMLFEPPAADISYLRLEVPAAAWGGRGAFRFTIPRALVRRGPASAAASGPRANR